MEYDKHFPIPVCINISIWTINYVVGDINFERRSNNASSACCTKKLSLQIPKYFHGRNVNFAGPNTPNFTL